MNDLAKQDHFIAISNLGDRLLQCVANLYQNIPHFFCSSEVLVEEINKCIVNVQLKLMRSWFRAFCIVMDELSLLRRGFIRRPYQMAAELDFLQERSGVDITSKYTSCSCEGLSIEQNNLKNRSVSYLRSAYSLECSI